MKASIQTKLETISERVAEISGLLAEQSIINNQNKFRELSIELAQLEPIDRRFNSYLSTLDDIKNAKELLHDSDPEMRAMAEDEIKVAKGAQSALEKALQIALLPKDPSDNCNTFLEIRAGTGGAEAAIFVGDLLKMYLYFAESEKWRSEIISKNESEQGGYKEVIIRIVGHSVYAKLKFESGAHRVQRVPETESQGRVHTSACTVAVLPEVDEVEAIDINPSDLRIDTFRASGAGGQHVNKTDSAIRITHLPSGVVIECQDERSQHKNKARAMSLLAARLLDAERSRQNEAQAESRKKLVGSGDRSERIRTYNYPQGRLTDHRINLTLYKLDDILQGSLNQVIAPLMQEYQADQLANLSE